MNQEMLDKTLEYIHLNPVVAGFVNKPEVGNTVVQETFAPQKADLRKD